LREAFGDEGAAHKALVEVTNPATGKKIVAPIVDKGPASWVEARDGSPAIDLTHGANSILGGDGKSPMQYRILGHSSTGLPPGFQLEGSPTQQPSAAKLPPGFVLTSNGGENDQSSSPADGLPQVSDSIADQLGLQKWKDNETGMPIARALPVTDLDKPKKEEVGFWQSVGRGINQSTYQTDKVIASAPATIAYYTDKAVKGLGGSSDFYSYWKDLMDSYDAGIKANSTQANEEQGAVGQIGQGLGSMAADLPAMLATGGLGAEANAAKLATEEAPGLFTAIKDAWPSIKHGIQSMALPALKAGDEAAQAAVENGDGEFLAVSKGVASAVTTAVTGALPLSMQSKIANPVLRVVQQGAMGWLTGMPVIAAQNVVNSWISGKPYVPEELKQLAIDAVPMGLATGAFGAFHAPATEAPVADRGNLDAQSRAAGEQTSSEAISGDSATAQKPYDPSKAPKQDDPNEKHEWLTATEEEAPAPKQPVPEDRMDDLSDEEADTYSNPADEELQALTDEQNRLVIEELPKASPGTIGAKLIQDRIDEIRLRQAELSKQREIVLSEDKSPIANDNKDKRSVSLGFFGEDPVIAYLLENPIRSRSAQARLDKVRGTNNAAEYDDAPKLSAVSHNKIFGGNQSIDQAHQALIDLGYIPPDSSISDLWSHIDRASKQAVAIGKAQKAEIAKQKAAIKEQKRLDILKQVDPAAWAKEMKKKKAKEKAEAEKEAWREENRRIERELTIKQNGGSFFQHEVPKAPEANDLGEAAGVLESPRRSDEAIQLLNSTTPRKNNRERFAPASDRELSELKKNPRFLFAARLAQIFGKKIVAYKGLPGDGINGVVGKDPRLGEYIFLNVDGARPHLFTLGHELWHHIEMQAPKLAVSLRDELLPLIKDWNGLNEKYRAAGYKPHRFFDEHIADFLGDSFQDPSFLEKLQDRNPKAFKDFATRVVKWLNQVLSELTGWKMSGDFVRDVETARNRLADALIKFHMGDNTELGPYDQPNPSHDFYQRDADRHEVEPGFYSQLQRTISDKMPNKASVDQIRAIIDPAKGSGVKPDEIKWSNLDGFLEGKKSVTKEEVLDYLKNEGAVKFEERTLKEEPVEGFPNQTIRPKYFNYTLPNGENYREVVLTMPEVKVKKPYEQWLKENFTGEDSKEARELYSIQREPGKNYTSSHFTDIPNYVAHMRLDERTDSSGKPGLFIEEIQSDRHQEGREKGYQNPERLKEIRKRIHEISKENGVSNVDELLRLEETNPEFKALAEEGKLLNQPNAVPDAPFRKDWSVQMFKRALRDAIASGKEWIGWTSGETQAERYDLSKQVSEVRYNPEHKYFQAWKRNVDPNVYQEPEIERKAEPKELEDLIGKDLAKKLIEGTPDGAGWVSIKGQALKVGGEGMKGFYDQILPKEVGKYVKKWGAKVEQGSLTPDESQFSQKQIMDSEGSVLDETQIWKVEITPEMRQSIEEVGQNFFQQDTEKNLVAVHNTDEAKLKNILKVNGLAAPSIAVIRADRSRFNSFGDITLVAPKDLIDPKADKKAKTFNADVYSPRYPSISYTIADRKAAGKLRDILVKAMDKMPESLRKDFFVSFESENADKPMEKRFSESEIFIAAFLADTGLIQDVPFSPSGDERYRAQSARWDIRNFVDENKEVKEDFKNWLSKAIADSGATEKEQIFNGYTPSGNRRYIPHTLDNVVKMMTKELRDGEGFNYGVGSIRSKAAKQFRTLEQIGNHRDHIVSESEMERLKEEVNGEFEKIAEEALKVRSSKPTFYMDAISDDLKALAEGGSENIKYLREMYPDGAPFEQWRNYLEKLRNLPTEYFESKIQRGVGLHEFTGAVVPEGTSPEVIAKLEAKGVHVVQYTKGDNEARAEAIRQIAGNDDNHFFQQDAPQEARGEKARKFFNPEDERIAQTLKDGEYRDPRTGEVIPRAPSFREKAGKTYDRMIRALKGIPEVNDYVRAKAEWTARNMYSTDEINRVVHSIKQKIKDPIRRAAITNWIEAGGSRDLLLARAGLSKDKELRKGYEAAANLSPEELEVAKRVTDAFRVLRNRGLKWGIDIGTIENYVPHLWKSEPARPAGSSMKRLSDNFKFAKEREIQDHFTGEQLGYKPKTKDIANLLGVYMNDMNNAINSRRFVHDLSKGKDADGRRLLSPPTGGGSPTITENGKTHLVFPDMRDENHTDYRSLDQPALKDWAFAGKTDEGSNILSKGNLEVHPAIFKDLRNVLGRSAIRDWWNERNDNPIHNGLKGFAKFLFDDVQGYAKATMFTASPFHQVQEGIHAAYHRVNMMSGIEKIDLRDPKQMKWAQAGLMLAHDKISQALFMEGLGGGDRNLVTILARKIPNGLGGKGTKALADGLEAYQRMLFERYIPGLKLKTAEHIQERNMKRFAKDLASGKITEEQVMRLSARQANAAYGHLNYADMGRNPTLQHILQIALLAPDFLEARGKFVAQAIRGLGSKAGGEQLSALAFGAATNIILAQIVNTLENGEPDWSHPFEVKIGNRYYGVRTVAEDVWKLVHDPQAFISGRVSPVVGKSIQEGVYQVNYRGEQVTFGTAIKDILTGALPMPVQSLTRSWTQTSANNPISPLEQILSSAGIQVHRYSPITEVYPMAREWMQKNHPQHMPRGRYPVTPYQQLRYALEDGDFAAARKQIRNLQNQGMNLGTIYSGFQKSVMSNFTNNSHNEMQFIQSLSPSDRQIYNAAIARRRLILQRYGEALRSQ
jgi:hypothetical protein